MRKIQNLLIYKNFQLKIMGFFLIFFACNTLMILAAMLFFFNNVQAWGTDFGLPPDHYFFEVIEKQKSYMSLLMLGLQALSLVIAIVFGFVLSHRVAGPLVRLMKHLRMAGENPKSPLAKLKFRDGDEFQELAAAYNEFAEKRNS